MGDENDRLNNLLAETPWIGVPDVSGDKPEGGGPVVPDGEPQFFEKVVPGAGKREIQVDLEAFTSGINKILEGEIGSRDALLGRLGSYLHYAVKTHPQAAKEIREKFVDHVAVRLAMFGRRVSEIVGLDCSLRCEFAHRAVGVAFDMLAKGFAEKEAIPLAQIDDIVKSCNGQIERLR